MVWRVEATMSIIKLARLTGLDGWYLMELEAGRRLPKAGDLEAIAGALRVAVELLMPASEKVAEPPAA